MCERCNANDGRRTKTYKIEKGEAVVSRELCDDCARLTNQTYPVRGVPGAPKTRRFLMAASQTIYKGAIVHMNSSGLAIPASDTAAQACVGIAAETMISAATGNFWIQVEYDREYLFAATSITQAMVGVNMVTVDDNTVD